MKQIITLFLLLPLISCSPKTDEKPSLIKLCYQNSYGAGEAVDFETLTLAIANTSVEGEFNWLPAFKDKRIGHFKGTKKHQTITAQYDYLQEGKKSNVEIQLRINNNSISVSGGEPALGLTSEIQQIDCKNLAAAPSKK